MILWYALVGVAVAVTVNLIMEKAMRENNVILVLATGVVVLTIMAVLLGVI